MMQPFRNDSETRFAGTKLLGAINRANEEAGALIGSAGLGAVGDVLNTRQVGQAQTELTKAQLRYGAPVNTGTNWGGIASGLASAITPLFGGGGGSSGGGLFGSGMSFGQAAKADFGVKPLSGIPDYSGFFKK